MVESIGFAILATSLLVSAIMVVTAENLVHCVLFLALTLVATAGVYLELQAGFMAGVQVLLYAGGVSTLMIFAVMLTRRQTGEAILQESVHQVRGALVATTVAALLFSFIWRTPSLNSVAQSVPPTPNALGKSFLTEFALPFEVLGVLLLAAMVGAIVIARKEDA
jgi:NADH:ubiquinone oxidoreductase subunit 6 (subunit J)